MSQTITQNQKIAISLEQLERLALVKDFGLSFEVDSETKFMRGRALNPSHTAMVNINIKLESISENIDKFWLYDTDFNQLSKFIIETKKKDDFKQGWGLKFELTFMPNSQHLVINAIINKWVDSTEREIVFNTLTLKYVDDSSRSLPIPNIENYPDIDFKVFVSDLDILKTNVKHIDYVNFTYDKNEGKVKLNASDNKDTTITKYLYNHNSHEINDNFESSKFSVDMLVEGIKMFPKNDYIRIKSKSDQTFPIQLSNDYLEFWLAPRVSE